MTVSTPSTGAWAPILRAHDLLTRAGFQLAACCLVAIVVSYVTEVVLRYGFDAPTTWAGSAVSYLLCATIFLVLPELTRTRAHIFISVLPDALSQANATRLVRAGYLAGCVACLCAAWFCADATLKQYAAGIETLNEWRVPKWTVSLFIPWGLASSGLYFLRNAVWAEPYVAATGEAAA